MTLFSASNDSLIRHFGQGARAVRREVSSLGDPNTGAAVTTLAVQGVTSSGETQITLDAAALIGKLPAGAVFTITGVAGTYTTTADVTAASNALTNVPINALEAEAPDDAVVTITQDYGEKTYAAARKQFRSDEIDGQNVTADDWKLIVATSDEFSPEDKRVTFDGRQLTIVRVIPFSPGTTQASVTLHCRG